MERRDFIRLSVAGAGASLVTPIIAQAETGKLITPPGDIFYTKDAPGRWAGKEATHLPTIEISKADGETQVKVTTAHEMKGYEHYIVKHVLLDKNFKFIAEHMFKFIEVPPSNMSEHLFKFVDEYSSNGGVPISTFTLKNYTGTLYALSLCNKHDLWLNSAEV